MDYSLLGKVNKKWELACNSHDDYGVLDSNY